jgi:hypothetical protein
MLDDILYLAVLAAVGFLAFVIGRKLSAAPKVLSKTTTFLIKSIQAIAELAVQRQRPVRPGPAPGQNENGI